MTVIERLGNNAVVPVVVIEDVKDAVPTARALLDGGIDVMEITLRTEAGLEAIRTVAEKVPEMMVGAGTVITLDEVKRVADAGARFVVSPGYDDAVVRWCISQGLEVTPGCVTPTELMMARAAGLKIVKFFPAGVYGGLAAMKSLAGPFGDMKFIPTGGVNSQNIGEFSAASFIHTVGGSWICTKADIGAGNFEKITRLCKEAVAASLGFEIAHVGVNTENERTALRTAAELESIFHFPVKNGNSSVFASSAIELMKSKYLGEHGHLSVKTNHIGRALAYLKKQGIEADMSTAKEKNGSISAVYLKYEIGGFAVHLLQK